MRNVLFTFFSLFLLFNHCFPAEKIEFANQHQHHAELKSYVVEDDAATFNIKKQIDRKFVLITLLLLLFFSILKPLIIKEKFYYFYAFFDKLKEKLTPSRYQSRYFAN